MNGTETRPTDHVEVQCRIEGQWIDGFEVFEIIQDGGLRRYRLRRLSDGVVMPVQYAAHDVRRKTVAADRATRGRAARGRVAHLASRRAGLRLVSRLRPLVRGPVPTAPFVAPALLRSCAPGKDDVSPRTSSWSR